ncbi:hypothetical protein ACLKA6_013504 [Drosophila palustris]
MASYRSVTRRFRKTKASTCYRYVPLVFACLVQPQQEFWLQLHAVQQILLSYFPFPAIRYREVTPEICALREKEQSDWKKLSLQEKKQLYRHSFCQTYSEFQYFTPDWKLVVGIGLWAIAIGVIFSMIYSLRLERITPDTFEEERRQAQLRRMIHLQVQPITGLSSKWCYATNKWK